MPKENCCQFSRQLISICSHPTISVLRKVQESHNQPTPHHSLPEPHHSQHAPPSLTDERDPKPSKVDRISEPQDIVRLDRHVEKVSVSSSQKSSSRKCTCSN